MFLFMKFIVSSSVLLKHLSTINGVIATNPVVPILENFLFKLDSSINIQTSKTSLSRFFENDEINDILYQSIPSQQNEKFDSYLSVHPILKEILNSVKIEKDKIDDLILNIYRNEDNLKYIHHSDFEKLICRLMAMIGFDVKPTKATRDGGFDAYLTSNSYFQTKQLLECKSFKNLGKVKISQIRNFMQVINDNNAHGGLLATNTDFTKDVINAVKNIYNRITLINGKEVLRLVRNYCNCFLLRVA